MRVLDDEAALHAAIDAPVAVIYKHSPVCGLSTIARAEVLTFMERHPGVPVFLVDVIRRRSVARAVAERLEVRHESPQVIVIRGGAAVWSASHRRVTADALASAAA